MLGDIYDNYDHRPDWCCENEACRRLFYTACVVFEDSCKYGGTCWNRGCHRCGSMGLKDEYKSENIYEESGPRSSVGSDETDWEEDT